MIRQESTTFATGWAAGVFATDGAGNPVEAGYYGGKLLDFTAPKINDCLWPQVRARIRDGVSAWWTCDTGGFMEGYYRNDPMGAHTRLYERWMQFSVFSPITRAQRLAAGRSPINLDRLSSRARFTI